MEAIGGVGGVGAPTGRFPLARPDSDKPKQDVGRSTLQEALYAGAALDLSKLYLSSTLRDRGFVDLAEGVQVVVSPKEAVEAFARETEQGPIEQILEMILRPDTQRVVGLIW